MIKTEAQKLSEKINKVARKIISSQVESRKILVEAGICTPKGNLKQVYK